MSSAALLTMVSKDNINHKYLRDLSDGMRLANWHLSHVPRESKQDIWLLHPLYQAPEQKGKTTTADYILLVRSMRHSRTLLTSYPMELWPLISTARRSTSRTKTCSIWSAPQKWRRIRGSKRGALSAYRRRSASSYSERRRQSGKVRLQKRLLRLLKKKLKKKRKKQMNWSCLRGRRVPYPRESKVIRSH
jgi:hypothetical protein